MIRLAQAAARNWAARGLASAAGHLPNTRSPFVSRLKFINSVTGDDELIPTYRVLDDVGNPVEGAEIPEVISLPRGPLYLYLTIPADRREICAENVREHAAASCPG
jgi:hypothetical protein